jgi:hypothetical protein
MESRRQKLTSSNVVSSGRILRRGGGGGHTSIHSDTSPRAIIGRRRRTLIRDAVTSVRTFYVYAFRGNLLASSF